MKLSMPRLLVIDRKGFALPEITTVLELVPLKLPGTHALQ